ncbi:hypothetical protein GF352_04360 [archaeon]|nr:hypothetical protein [archaeon]
MRRRGQYSLIVFVIATFVLLSLTGVVSNIMAEQSEQIRKAQDLTHFGDYVNGIRTIQYQERQQGIDTAGFYLGSIGIWPKGSSKCGTARNLSSYWILKDIPYWKSSSDTAAFYTYEGELYSETDAFRTFRFRDVREGLYEISVSGVDNVSPFLLNSAYEEDNELFLPSGDHLVLVTNALSTGCNSPCDYTISCDCASPTNVFPEEMNLNRVIPEDSEYETCVPDNELIIYYFEKIINDYFNEMDPLAWLLINDFIESADFGMELFFPLITYDTEIEKIGSNALFITFYPLSGRFFSIKHQGLVNASYQGNTIVHNAFDSDFARFRGAAVEVINKSIIREQVSDILDSHAYFEIVSQKEVTGIDNPAFESFLNAQYDAGLNFNSFDFSNLEFEDYFGFELKPHCLYYLKEVCQFMSNEVDKHEVGNYTLFNEFTSQYDNLFGADVLTLHEVCKGCYDVSQLSGPCVNISNPFCRECFRLAFNGVDYADAVDYSDEPIPQTSCRERVNEQVLPLITSNLGFNLRSIEEELKDDYGFDWRLDPSRINITEITFLGIEETGSLFNSSCDNCEEVDFSYAQCKDFKPSLIPMSLVLRTFDGVVISEGNTVDTAGDRDVNASFNLLNDGSTIETSYLLRVLVDSGSEEPGDSDEYFDSEYGIGYDLEVINEVVSIDELGPDGVLSVDLGPVFNGEEVGVITGSQRVFVCAESAFNDEYDLSDSCISGVINLCDDQDDAPGCCAEPNVWFYGDLPYRISELSFRDPECIYPCIGRFEYTPRSGVGGEANNVFVSGDYAYVAASDDGLRVVDVSDPFNPVQASHEVLYYVDVAVGVFVSDGYAYVANGDDGLRVIDVSDPENAFVTNGYLNTGGFAIDVSIVDNYAYLITRDNGLFIVDVSDPTVRPLPVISNVSPVGDRGGYPSSGIGVFVSGDYAYIANSIEGMDIVDISDPANPVSISNTDLETFDVFVSGDYAYIASFDEGLFIVDVSDPFNPAVVSQVPGLFGGALGGSREVFVNNGKAYVADSDNGLGIIDVSDPINPDYIGHFGFGNIHSVFVSDGYVYFTNYLSKEMYAIDAEMHPATYIEDFDIGDVDNDGDLDIVATTGTDIVVLFNEYDGFTGINVYSFDNLVSEIALGDLDKDGDLDAVTIRGDPNRRFYVLENNGVGGFSLDSSDNNLFFGDDVALGKINLGGRLDWVFSGRSYSNSYVSVWINDFNSYPRIKTNDDVSAPIKDLLIDDFNSDGFNDIVGGSGADIVEISSHPYYDFMGGVYSVGLDTPVIILDTLPEDQEFAAMDSADFDSDGDPDLAGITSDNGIVYLWTNEGRDVFEREELININDRGLKIVFSDLNNDGFPDIIVSAENNGLIIFMNDRNGGFIERADLGYNDLTSISEIGVADIDSDKARDVIFLNEVILRGGVDNLYLMLNQGKVSEKVPCCGDDFNELFFNSSKRDVVCLPSDLIN